MNQPIHKDIVIIGAGLTGLTAAFYLSKAGLDVAVIEKQNITGGVMQTKSKNGFVYETGPNTGVIGNEAVVDLFKDLGNSCELEIANPEAKRRLIWKGGRWHDLPNGLNGAFTPLFIWKDKFRVLGEPFRAKGTDPHENLTSFVQRRLGQSILNYAVDPFVSGVYAGDPDRLIPKYALPKLYNLEQEYGSFIKGSMARGKIAKAQREAGVTKDVFSAKGGLHKMIEALEQKIGVANIFLKAEGTTIEKAENEYQTTFTVGNEAVAFTSKYVISTVGSYVLPNLFPFLEKKELATIDNLNYAKVTQMTVGYKNWTGTDIMAFGGLVPTVEQKDILGVLYTSSFFVDRAPKNGALLSVFIGGMKKPHLFEKSDDELKAMVDQHLQEMFGVSIAAADLVEINRYQHAIPQYEVSTGERLKTIERIEKANPGLYLAGGIRNGIGMADRIKQAKAIAEEIINSK